MIEDDEDPLKIKKEDKVALENAQKKYDMLMEKRGELNNEANKSRNERDILNQEKSNLIQEMASLKQKREVLKIEIEKHKKLRDTYQKNAKNLLGAKKNRNKDQKVDLDSDIEILNSEIMEMERKYETTPLAMEEEKKVVEKIRVKRRKLQELMKELPVQTKLSDEIKTVDERISELFKLADDEHKLFAAGVEESRKLGDSLGELYSRTKHLGEESQKKHEEFLETKERANKFHLQIVEMREKIMAIRKDQRLKRDEALKLVRDQNEKVRATLEDETALKDFEDKALEALLKKGKFRSK
jgi:uncharacterized coiled-coil DUF342 family protein